MDIIKINNKEYDPYFILDVTKDDSMEHIKKSFRSKVKKYHPDKFTDKKQKEKYEIYFKILSESYEYIKNKRENTNDLNLNRKKNVKDKDTKRKDNKERDNKEDSNDDFNKKFVEKKERTIKKKEEKDKRLKNIDEYSEYKPEIYNPLSKKKFSNKEFNQIFEYNKKLQEINDDEIREKSLIYYTTDGFRGYNSGNQNDNCALVSSYNGLLITEAELKENEAGYWSNNYSDYNISFKKSAKNPSRDFKLKELKESSVNNTKNSKHTKLKTEKDATGSFKSQQQSLIKDIYNSLLEKEEKDKNIVLNNLHLFDEATIKKALSGELSKSLEYSSVLQKYICN